MEVEMLIIFDLYPKKFKNDRDLQFLSAIMDKAFLRSVYRRLWRAGHYAVQYRAPGKYAIRETLRRAFRTESQLPTAVEIDNTEQFLRTAGRRRGMENNIVRGLCLIHYNRSRRKPRFALSCGFC